MLDQLLEDISETLTNQPEDMMDQMRALLVAYQESGDIDWMKYKFSNPHSYSRNLVYISPLFEAILLVWDKGQVSPIHNHNQSNCFFVVMEGVISEVKYDYVMKGDKASLTQIDRTSYPVGEVAVVNEGAEVLHKVGSEGGIACTLHIYNRPIYKCNIYCPLTGNVECRKPGFYTIYGKLLDSDITIYKNVYDELEASDNARALLSEGSAPMCNALLSSIRDLKSSIEMKKNNESMKPTFLDLVDHEEEFSHNNLGGYT